MKELVTFEQALKFKQLGFNEYCDRVFSSASKTLVTKKQRVKNSNLRNLFITAGRIVDALEWLREHENIKCAIFLNMYLDVTSDNPLYKADGYKWEYINPKSNEYIQSDISFPTHLKAASALLTSIFDNYG